MPEQNEQLLKALDLADAGKWDAAHDVVAKMSDPLAAWVHANLHREEGDHGNAGYWYARAGEPFSELTFAEERAQIRKRLG